MADPQFLTAAAREHLRERFLTSPIAITGVNFAIAGTGEVVVCTNEGNADLGVQLADVHIACMGIEKLVPQRQHMGVFLRSAYPQRHGPAYNHILQSLPQTAARPADAHRAG